MKNQPALIPGSADLIQMHSVCFSVCVTPRDANSGLSGERRVCVCVTLNPTSSPIGNFEWNEIHSGDLYQAKLDWFRLFNPDHVQGYFAVCHYSGVKWESASRTIEYSAVLH